MPASEFLQTHPDGLTRCWWPGTDPQYLHYHDNEWGHPVADDFRLFEKMNLEGFQSGLSWLTILRKRENFRAAFAHFDFHQIASFDPETKTTELLQNAGIIRHRGKIEATLNNAHRAVEIANEFGSLAAYIWQWEPTEREPHIGKGEYHWPMPSVTKTSTALSKDLKKRGWKFFGPTTAYAFMQAMGLVNDHLPECHFHSVVEHLRTTFTRPT